MLLKVETIGDKRAAVRVYSDALMFRKAAAAYDDGPAIHELMGMSIIGPEQSIRAIAAGCALVQGRTPLAFIGERRTLQAMWAWKWNASAVQLAPGAMHLVAIAQTKDIMNTAKEPKKIGCEFVVIPPEPTPEALERHIYDLLLTHFSTPLIPAGRPGQPEWEKIVGRVWRKWVVSTILRDPSQWTELLPHPEQPDKRWFRAGILTMRDEDLDKLVSGLVQRGRLIIPQPERRRAS